MNKKAYTLLLTILVLTIFSYIGIVILETKSIKNVNIQNKYLFIQAKNHKEFLKSYIKNIKLEGIKKIDIEDSNFNINAFIKKSESSYIVDIFVKSKKFDISIHERIIKELPLKLS